MNSFKVSLIRSMFLSRLDTLELLIDIASKHFQNAPEAIFEKKLVSDMLPLGTQSAFTCNQPHNFSLWCEGKNLSKSIQI